MATVFERTFPKGVHPHDFKELSKDKAIERMPAPDTVFIPVNQHIGAPAEVVVNPGDKVAMGQLICKAGGFVSSNIFSSVSGEVVGIVDRLTATGTMAKHIEIKNDKTDTPSFLPKLTNPSKEEILARVKDAGIVGLGGAAFPTHVKLSPPKDKEVDTLLINAAECEPYITCDDRVMLELTEKFIGGVKLLAKALGVEKIGIGIESNKRNAFDHLTAYCEDKGIEVVLLKKKYPQGAEKQLIYAITRRAVPAGGLPADIGCVVSNVHTALSTYEAVYEGKPLFERVLTVTGSGIKEPKNFWARTGVTYQDLVDFCGGIDGEIAKIVSGGPMMGFACENLTPAVSKACSALLLLKSNEIETGETTACINCGKCASVCPMYLMPMYIDSNTLANDYVAAKKYGAMNCIECGCCAYVCPANRRIVQNVRRAKKFIKERNI